eukprot:scaffold36531_cov33-Phaeocystis_antarctica.AAC.1
MLPPHGYMLPPHGYGPPPPADAYGRPHARLQHEAPLAVHGGHGGPYASDHTRGAGPYGYGTPPGGPPPPPPPPPPFSETLERARRDAHAVRCPF